MKYTSTADGRNAAVHERSLVAGSGDPRRVAAEARAPSTAATHHPGTERPRARQRSVQPGDKPEEHISESELGVASQE
jgi:hypothetical protein